MKLPVLIGDYTLIETVGAGAFGTVYRARVQGEMGFAQDVAVKVVDAARSSTNPALVVALADEASFLARIQHPHIVSVRRFAKVSHDVLGDLWLMEMELIRGRALKDVIRELRRARRRLPVEAVLSLLIEAADALRYAHSLRGEDGRAAGLVHRDLKPDNMIVSDDGRMKVLDFGIAWAEDRIGARTETGVAKGTPLYMSPEQARGDRLDGRSDVYSLGAIAFELLTGTFYVPIPPSGTGLPALMRAVVTTRFEDRRPLAAARLAHAGEDPTPVEPARASALLDLVGSMLAPTVQGRPADANGLLTRLEEVASGLRLHLGRRYLRAIIATPLGEGGAATGDGRGPDRIGPPAAVRSEAATERSPGAVSHAGDDEIDPDLTTSEEVALRTWVSAVVPSADADTVPAQVEIGPGAGFGPPPGLAPGTLGLAPPGLAPPGLGTVGPTLPQVPPTLLVEGGNATRLVPQGSEVKSSPVPLFAIAGAVLLLAGVVFVRFGPVGRSRGGAELRGEDGLEPLTSGDASGPSGTINPVALTPPGSSSGPTVAAVEGAAGGIGSAGARPGPTPSVSSTPPSPTPSASSPRPSPTPTPSSTPPGPTPVPAPDWPRLRHEPPGMLLPGNPLLVRATLDGGTAACLPELYIAPAGGAFARHPLRPAGGDAWEVRVDIPYDGSFDQGARYFLRCCDGPRCGPSAGSREAPLRLAAPSF